MSEALGFKEMHDNAKRDELTTLFEIVTLLDALPSDAIARSIAYLADRYQRRNSTNSQRR